MDEALVNFRAMDLLTAIEFNPQQIDDKLRLLVDAIAGQDAATKLAQIPKNQQFLFVLSLYIFVDTRSV